VKANDRSGPILIGELSSRTGVPARLLRYYEEQDLLHPERDSNGYRCYDTADVDRVEQIRGLLDSGLTTEIIRRILPFLACGIHLPAQCLTAETAELLEREAERLGQRIDCLSRNRDAILAYLTAVRGPAGPRLLLDWWTSPLGCKLAARARSRRARQVASGVCGRECERFCGRCGTDLTLTFKATRRPNVPIRPDLCDVTHRIVALESAGLLL
jgi:DNA-binding transcriptional MerR regulator